MELIPLVAVAVLTVWIGWLEWRVRHTSNPPAADAMHEWRFGSLEQTDGRNIRAYVCEYGHDRHVERREV